MPKFYIFVIALMLNFTLSAQISDNFSDGDYTHDPVWSASENDFIVNNNFQLQSANQTPSSTFAITTRSALAERAQWEFWVRLDFNPSSVNYTDVWLISASNDLNSTGNEGYFVRIGGTADNISLFRKKSSDAPIALITGTNGLLNASTSTLKIKVIRTTSNRWILLRDITGTGNGYKSEGEIMDADIVTSFFFGISIRQSTSSFFQKHFFDDFKVEEFTNEPTALRVISSRALDNNSAQIIFDNPLGIASAADVTHYHVNGIGNPVSATVDERNGNAVNLIFSSDFTPNQNNSLIIDGVIDVFGNTITGEFSEFTLFKANRYDVVIDEVFADPSPQVGLPARKFIELRNMAGFPVNIFNWQLRDDTHTALLPAIEIPADGYLIITTTTGVEDYTPFGTTIGIANFPSLNIGGGQISLYNNSGSLIHAMRYSTNTYGNSVKQDGGFSLEMIAPHAGCLIEGNWTASNDKSGGTPGRKNSVDGKLTEPQKINITRVYPESPRTLVIQFSKPADSIALINPANYSFTNGLSVNAIGAIPPFFDQVSITLSSAIADNQIYIVTVSGLTDCVAGSMGTKDTASFGIPGSPESGDIVINEILPNPKTKGAEYVELYNNSGKIFDAGHLFIANRSSAGDLASITRLSETPLLMMPGGFLLLTKDPVSTVRDYFMADAYAMLKMASMPSTPNDAGFVIILDQQGNILDEVNYNKSWEFPLIKDPTGVSLERIDYNGPSNASNFHSAAEDAGYGTPGIKNSQHTGNGNIMDEFRITPEVFSPDNDGLDDFITIHYKLPASGYITNIKIFDASGRMVRYLQKNSVSSVQGFFRWDGLDDKQQKLPQGIYVIYSESYNENGKKIIHKKSVVLARRF